MTELTQTLDSSILSTGAHICLRYACILGNSGHFLELIILSVRLFRHRDIRIAIAQVFRGGRTFTQQGTKIFRPASDFRYHGMEDPS